MYPRSADWKGRRSEEEDSEERETTKRRLWRGKKGWKEGGLEGGIKEGRMTRHLRGVNNNMKSVRKVKRREGNKDKAGRRIT